MWKPTFPSSNFQYFHAMMVPGCFKALLWALLKAIHPFPGGTLGTPNATTTDSSRFGLTSTSTQLGSLTPSQYLHLWPSPIEDWPPHMVLPMQRELNIIGQQRTRQPRRGKFFLNLPLCKLLVPQWVSSDLCQLIGWEALGICVLGQDWGECKIQYAPLLPRSTLSHLWNTSSPIHSDPPLPTYLICQWICRSPLSICGLLGLALAAALYRIVEAAVPAAHMLWSCIARSTTVSPG